MKITINFGNSFTVTVYTVSSQMIGWAIGAHWGRTLSSAWMILFATILLLPHDAAIAILLAKAAIKVSSGLK